MNNNREYVLVTAARNEVDYIEKTLKSVISQSILPRKWIIISDGSTDGTDLIVRQYASEFDFIEYLRKDSSGDRNFGSKVRAIHTGYAWLNDLKFDFFGNLDADITFDENYYENILNRFDQYPNLGIAGGNIIDIGDEREQQPNIVSPDSVGCAVQFFRRQCYEDIGGYLPLQIGGEDAAAEIMARMYHWEVRTFPDIRVLHHRPMGTGMWSVWGAKFFYGVENYTLGYHPLFFFLKSMNRMKTKPYILGSVLMLGGYIFSYFTGKKKVLPNEVLHYFKSEQINKIKDKFNSLFTKDRSRYQP